MPARLRATSDVNVILVLTNFVRTEIEQMAPALNMARAAIRLEAMFCLRPRSRTSSNVSLRSSPTSRAGGVCSIGPILSPESSCLAQRRFFV